MTRAHPEPSPTPPSVSSSCPPSLPAARPDRASPQTPAAPSPPDPAVSVPPASQDHRIPLGRSGEDLALTWLLARGYRLLERNYRFGRHGELDLIMETPDGDLAFVEVKTGLSDAAGDPLGWVNGRKQHKIQRIAQAWCLERGVNMDRPMRFDAVGVQASTGGDALITHVPHAFLPDGAGYWRG